ncbi:uncharacterized protein LOC122246546 [Penaeus japonicus]|uniref:uncharacterized protein LOC122246546 n=1 Tax=Penaeus japonicus TaxID=27405 RepID=UPI001C7175F4|nr:uncharacterized protein LOC122246546 [Penaeus japonicus]XP_042861114.1 uncharacterized protein LOC122246546 [Penaeus japonicus]XP_042861115.1 uncharacterized protein LOC122246546 [Penaeus japonicus]
MAEGFPTAGKRQSPVDISAPRRARVPPFAFKNYGLINVSLENNGHSLSADLHPLQEQQRPRIAEGGLSGTFELAGFHFHWGDGDSRGSEHLLGGCAFPAEMHLVHYKRKYGSVKVALQHADGLAVLGVWLTPGRDSDDSSRATEDVVLDQSTSEDDHSAAAKKWFRALTPSGKELNKQLITVNLRQLIPFDVEAFYRYNGSLTTPGCTENVEWTVFENPVTVPLRFLKGLRALANEEGELLANNFRPPQALGKRKVLYSGSNPKRHPTCSKKPKTLTQDCTSLPSLASFGTDEPNQCSGGHETSPADLHLGDAEPSLSKPLRWKRRGGCASAVVEMEDRILKVVFPGEEPQWELSGGHLATPHYLSHMLFRWGSDHHLGGLSFPLEVQLVHYGSESEDVVVVSKFFQEPIDLPDVLDSYQHTEPSKNSLLEVILEAALEVSEDPDTETQEIPAPDVDELAGDASSFYEYAGSFPGVPCLGDVTWMVLRTAGQLSRSQLQELRQLRDKHGEEISSNNRPVKPLGNRKLYLRVSNRELVHEYNTMLQRPKRDPETSSAPKTPLQHATLRLQLLCFMILALPFVAV